MICTRCGWMFDEEIDCSCSGCGQKLRGLSLPESRERYTLSYGRGASALIIPVENDGEFPIRITESWEFIGLEALRSTLDGRRYPPVELPPGETKRLEVDFDGSRLPFSQAGILRLFAGIAPPVNITISCSPVPIFHFYVNGRLVRDGKVRVLSKRPEKPDLLFRIEMSRSYEAIWTQWRLYPQRDRSRALPIPGELIFPIPIREEALFEFSIHPDLEPLIGNAPIQLIAEFDFENCPPEKFTIEIVEEARIEHKQDIYLIHENAFIMGKSRPRKVKIILFNAGGVGAEILQIRSLSEPWLTIASEPHERKLKAYRESETSFYIWVDPNRIEDQDVERFGEKHSDGSISLNGQICLSFRELESNKPKEQFILVGVEIKPAKRTRYIAIDFGNTNTCVSFLGPRNEFEVVALDPDYPEVLEFPTIIDFYEFSPPGEPETAEGFRYGHQLGKTRYAVGDNLQHRVWHFKRNLGLSEPIGRLGRANMQLRQFTPEELTAFFLCEVVRRFESKTGSEVDRLIITYPASFLDLQKETLSRAAARVKPDLEVITEISEPEALALNYLRKKEMNRPCEIFSVFDFGGGSTDITIGRFGLDGEIKTVEILLSMGLDQLGGELLTFELARDIYDKARHSCQKDPEKTEFLFPERFEDIFKLSLSEKEKLYNFMNIMNQAEALKTDHNGCYTQLSQEGKISIKIPDFYARREQHEPCVISYTIDDFTMVAGKQIRSGFEKLQGMLSHLKKHGIIDQEQSMGFIILGGNSSKLPLVRELAREVLGLPDEVIFFDPEITKTGVAIGAAYYGMLREELEPDILFDNPPRLKFPLGVNKNGEFDVLFPAGSEIGRSVERLLRPTIKDPRLTIYQNLDPSNPMLQGNPNVKEVATHDLAPYQQQSKLSTKLCLTLTREGITVSTNQENGLIKITW